MKALLKIQVISAKEHLSSERGQRLWPLSIGLILVMLAAMAIGLTRASSLETERIAAAESDKTVWLAQGERNPHEAAHFSRYVFKPIPTLSGFDPGIIDFAGVAMWLEAHIQNPTRFRRAESTGDLSRLVALSPAWVIQVLLPLVIVLLLFASYAGEREDGTLRQVMSFGISTKSIFYGKLYAAFLALLKLSLPIFLLIVIAVVSLDNGAKQPDLLLRLFAIILTYSLYLLSFAMLTIGVSALSSNRRNAAIALLSIWCTTTILIPRLANDVALNITPQPDSYQTWQDLVSIKHEYWGVFPPIGVPLTEHRKKVLEQFLTKFQVNKAEEAPVTLRAWELQSSEEFSNPLFDDYYSELNSLFQKQESARFWLSVLSPTISLTALSSGFSGTDRLHHSEFVKSAETNRRKIIKQLNEELITHSKTHGISYKSSPEFWQKIADYKAEPMQLAQLFPHYFSHILVMLLWAIGAFFFARWAALKATNMETLK